MSILFYSGLDIEKKVKFKTVIFTGLLSIIYTSHANKNHVSN